MKKEKAITFLGIILGSILLICTSIFYSTVKIEYFEKKNNEIILEVSNVTKIDKNLIFSYQGKEYSIKIDVEDEVFDGENYKLIFEVKEEIQIRKKDVNRLLKETLKRIEVIEDCGESCPVM